MITLILVIVEGGYGLLRQPPGLWLDLFYTLTVTLSVAQFVMTVPDPLSKNALRSGWLEALTLPLLLASLIIQPVDTRIILWIRQAASLFRIYSSSRSGQTINALFLSRPALLLMVTFALGIALGTLVLTLPAATIDRNGAPLLTALFTTTSAICVTGLTVVDLSSYFSQFGLLMILAMIQLGGFGIMTFATGITLLVGLGLGYKKVSFLENVLEEDSPVNLEQLIRSVIKTTLGIELIAATFLFFHFLPDSPTTTQAGFSAVFHAVSAFCNAGMSLYQDNLSQWVGDPIVNLIISLLIIIGGIGFPIMTAIFNPKHFFHTVSVNLFKGTLQRRLLFILVFIAIFCTFIWALLTRFGSSYQLQHHLLNPGPVLIFFSLTWTLLTMFMAAILASLFFGSGRHLQKRIMAGLKKQQLHVRLTILMTTILLGLGFILFYYLEYNHSLANLSTSERLIASFFQSVTTRTAGFSTINMAEISTGTILLMSVLMFIGASPGSMGGGIKTTTVAVLFLSIKAMLTQRQDVEFGGRTIPQRILYKAVAILVVSQTLIISLLSILLITDPQQSFVSLMFESISAFATVGLSIGITPEISNPGKLILVILMYVGRVGPITLAAAVGERVIKARFRYPSGRVMVG